MSVDKKALLKQFNKSLDEFIATLPAPDPLSVRKAAQVVRNALEERWLTMTEDQQCLAYGKAVLADAAQRDKVFPRENNVANARYEMATKYAYGSGAR